MIGQLISTPFFAVLLCYDYFLTLPDELELVWRRKMNTSSWLFGATRVTAAVYCIGITLGQVAVVRALSFVTARRID